jgi:hypothetical protein
MDGGQVALSADGTTQFSTWMNNDDGKRRLFFASLKTGEAPKGACLIDYPNQQGHPVVTPLGDGRAFIAFETNEGISVAVINAEGKVEKKEELTESGNFPRLVQTKDAVVVTWESMKGVQTRSVAAEWWKRAD